MPGEVGHEAGRCGAGVDGYGGDVGVTGGDVGGEGAGVEEVGQFGLAVAEVVRSVLINATVGFGHSMGNGVVGRLTASKRRRRRTTRRCFSDPCGWSRI